MAGLVVPSKTIAVGPTGVMILNPVGPCGVDGTKGVKCFGAKEYEGMVDVAVVGVTIAVVRYTLGRSIGTAYMASTQPPAAPRTIPLAFISSSYLHVI